MDFQKYIKCSLNNFLGEIISRFYYILKEVLNLKLEPLFTSPIVVVLYLKWSVEHKLWLVPFKRSEFFLQCRGITYPQTLLIHWKNLTWWELYKTEAAIFLFELDPDSALVLDITIPFSGVHFIFLTLNK